MTGGAPRSALLIEREGVLIDPGWTAPGEIRLMPGAAAAIARFALAGVPVAVVTDRWLAAHGGADFAASQRRVDELLAAAGARLAGVWHAPSAGHAWVKPRAGMLLTAAKALGCELPASWLIGASLDDAHAAALAGLAGAVLIGADPPATDLGIVCARAESLADAPRAMVPRDGGCWHQH
ncbi:MAG TPA: HAD-IIIA family hydrolase [Planctomycetota bacterium]|nr:HAD-IIIA family hydrolase [Planctomycetota bacterium]